MADPGESPLVSIALCTYNGALYLEELLQSLLVQTHQNFEIIASDDCSTDRSAAILRDLAQRDDRVRVFVNATNLGHTRNFEFALSQCSGDYIAPCDQDDIWSRDKLRILLNTLRGSAIMAYCDSDLIDAAGKSLGIRMSDLHSMISTEDPAVFAMANCVSGHAMLFKRELLQRALPISDCFFYDWWLAAVAAASGGVVYCDLSLVQYRQHGANVTDSLGIRKSEKRRTGKLERWDATRARLACLAQLTGPQQPFLIKLHALWDAHGRQWFSFSLAWFVAIHSGRLHALFKRSKLWSLEKSFRLIRGLRLKRLMSISA
jgi:glycosyltransferase involved in cell wall biosynthesis